MSFSTQACPNCQESISRYTVNTTNEQLSCPHCHVELQQGKKTALQSFLIVELVALIPFVIVIATLGFNFNSLIVATVLALVLTFVLKKQLSKQTKLTIKAPK